MDLDAQLRRRAAVPTSALVRRLLRQAVPAPRKQFTEANVESIERRVAREELHREEPDNAAGWTVNLAAKLAANCANFCGSRRMTSDALMPSDLTVSTAVDAREHRLSLLKSVGSAVRARP